MDHLIEHESDPVPDLTNAASSSSAPSANASGSGQNEDDDEDAEALRAVYGAGGAAGNVESAGLEAKVRHIV